MGDYGRGTGHLSLQDHGAYTLLLDHYYSTRCPLPADIDSIRRICKAITESETESVSRVAGQFFPVGQDGLRHNKRCDEEIATAKAYAEAQSMRSHMRWQSPRISPEDASHSHSHSHRLETIATGQKPETAKSKTKSKATAVASLRGPGNGAGRTKETETAYRQAITERYGEDPGELNGKQRGMLARFLDRVPIEEAPAIVRHYVASSRGLYAGAKHCIDLLLRDAESIRLMWRTGAQSTDSEARQQDETATRGAIFNKLIAEAREKEKHGK